MKMKMHSSRRVSLSASKARPENNSEPTSRLAHISLPELSGNFRPRDVWS